MARIAYYGSGGAPYHHAAILTRAGHDAAFVFPADIEDGALDSFDAFVMPGGGYRAMQGQLEPLGRSGCRAIREYVERGGMYIGSCAGSYDAATVPPAFTDVCPEQGELRLLDARVWNGGAGMLGVIQSPGIGVLTARNTDPDHPVMAGIGPEFRITHYNGPLFAGGHALATVSGWTDEFTAAEDFLGPAGGPALLRRGIEQGVANIVAGRCGAGRVVLFGSHPEFGTRPAMDDEAATARMLLNAVQWQLAETRGGGRSSRDVTVDGPVPDEVRAADLAALPGLVEQITEACAALAGRTPDAPWLAEDAAMSLFGRGPVEVWTSALTEIPVLAAEAAKGAADLPPALLSFRPPADWPVDGGFHGVAALLTQAADMLTEATSAWPDGGPGAVSDVYEYLRESPYHLVAGSYLAAIGRVAAAALLVRANTA
ncbi:MAG TPA: BPL-N domain-containing protein [Pseudonocardiaceae bacterium]|jgi:hypothetical protein|nr:BPL-N domain-containing protein [Pseudonocardiaceae bacterium]